MAKSLVNDNSYITWVDVKGRCMLCISNSKLVLLHTPFAGRNHLLLHFNKFFHIFPSLMEKKKEKRNESHTKTCKNMHFSPGVDQLLGSTSSFLLFLYYFIHFMTEKDVKSCLSAKKLILNRKLHAEPPFAGRNTQQVQLCRDTKS